MLLALVGAGLVVGAVWRYDSALPSETPSGIAVYNDIEDSSVHLRALVSAEPDERSTSVRYRLSVREVMTDDG